MIQTDDLPIVPMPDKVESGQSALKALEGLSIDDALTKIANSIVDFGFKLLIAILIFYIGRFIIGRIFKFVHSVMVSRKIDASLTTFVLSLIRMVLYFILIITVVGILGIETSSFLALFASAGVAIGMALSGTLQNFAGGVLILLLKPYRVGDFIEAGGFTGTVKEIQIFHTVINTTDNKAIIVPNGGLSTGSINNYSLEEYRRVDWTVSLAYDTDYPAAAEFIKKMLLEDDRVVVKYIEDDKQKRRAKGLDKSLAVVADIEEDSSVPEEKLSFFKRIRRRQKRHSAKIQQKMREQMELNAAIPSNVDRSPFVGLNELADSSINLVVRAWTHSDNYWGLFFDMNQRFFAELPKAGFEFPFPQLDVHLKKTLN